MTIQAPQLDINTVAAGGGSLLTFRSGLFAVGPESSGADPGQLTVVLLSLRVRLLRFIACLLCDRTPVYNFFCSPLTLSLVCANTTTTTGPVCYRKGGMLSITDANAVLGRLQPDFFPKIFGRTEREPLDVDGAVADAAAD